MTSALASELQQSIRRLRHELRFVVLVVLMLGLALGGTTAMFAVVRAVLLTPLPYPDAGQLVLVGHRHAQRGEVFGAFSPDDHADLAERAGSIVSSTAYFDGAVNASIGGVPTQLDVAFVDGRFFDTLGSAAQLGRTLLPYDDVPGNDVIVLSHATWQTLLGGDTNVVGRTVSIRDRPFRVVGVMAPEIDFPTAGVQAWLPLSFLGEDDVPRNRDVRWLDVLARLRPDVDISAARSEIATIVAAIAEAHPATNDGWEHAIVRPVFDEIVGSTRASITALFAATALVLLIASVNFANLLLVRAQRRERELATRGALGADPGRLATGLVAESLVLSAGGAVLGTLLAFGLVDAFIDAAGTGLTRRAEIRVDATVLLAGFALTLATALATSAYPAWRARRTDIARVLASGGKSSSTREHARVRSALVIAQIALVCALGYATGLSVDSLRRVAAIDTGIDTDRVFTFNVRLDGPRYDPEGANDAARARILEALRAMPGVVSAASSKTAVIGATGESYGFTLADQPDQPIRPDWGVLFVSDDYFRTLGIPLQHGRDFESVEPASDRFPIIVNEAFAEQFLAGRDAVGQSLQLLGYHADIVGLVGNARHAGPRQPPKPAVYAPTSVFSRSSVTVSVRTRTRSPEFFEHARTAVASVDPALPLVGMRWLDEQIDTLESTPRLLAMALSAFAVIAAAIGGLGVFGLLAYVVGERRRELAIRLALGARPDGVFGTIVGHGSRLALLGLALGLPLGLAAARLLQPSLFGTRAFEPTVLATVVLAVLALASAAGVLPALSAVRIQPMQWLRHD